MSLADKIKGKTPNDLKREGPIWRGPQEDGITFSLLSRFLVCRERFRILVCEGLKPVERFNHRIEYGNMWHTCEEVYKETKNVAVRGGHSTHWETALHRYCISLAQKYPTDQSQISQWYNVCRVQFPLYLQHWQQYSAQKVKNLFTEETFCVFYDLPSGRTVKLRGKFDSVDICGKGKKTFLSIQENKTKGDINEVDLRRQVTYDLQTMMYITALQEVKKQWADLKNESDRKMLGVPSVRKLPVSQIVYNVVRRPLSGGKHTIRKHKPTKSNPTGESDEEFYNRLSERIKEDPEFFFFRLTIEISQEDVERFRRRTLNPILEQLCDWWEFQSGNGETEDHADIWGFNPRSVHFQYPYGVYNPMLEGGYSDVDDYIREGLTTGLRIVDNLFPEL